MVARFPILLSTAYLPTVQYVSKFLLGPVLIESQENYQKQSYRNRCYIYGANGKQCLVIPVKKLHGENNPVLKIEIDYCSNWQKIHLKSIESAYKLSPFYDYYADDIKTCFEKKTPHLFQWNLDLLLTMLQMLGIENIPALTETWEKEPAHGQDLRLYIHPKSKKSKPDAQFIEVPYQQVFQERYGFIGNLSVIDLLFNEGPLASDLLKKSLGNQDSEQKFHP
jgi:hypothetical protein